MLHQRARYAGIVVCLVLLGIAVAVTWWFTGWDARLATSWGAAR